MMKLMRWFGRWLLRMACVVTGHHELVWVVRLIPRSPGHAGKVVRVSYCWRCQDRPE